MALPTAVNGQITDSVTQTNVKTIASAPAVAMSSLYQSAAHSMGLAVQNATSAQQQANTLSGAVAALCSQILTNGRSE
jgi:flagellar basal body L-ring protein FlgH